MRIEANCTPVLENYNLQLAFVNGSHDLDIFNCSLVEGPICREYFPLIPCHVNALPLSYFSTSVKIRPTNLISQVLSLKLD